MDIIEDINDTIKFGNDISMKSISNGIQDYVLKCISKQYKNRYVYINVSNDGDGIGNDDDNTLCIKDVGLSSKHAHIQVRNGYYYLKDTSSFGGVWYRYASFEGISVVERLEILIHDNNVIFDLEETEMGEKALICHYKQKRYVISSNIDFIIGNGEDCDLYIDSRGVYKTMSGNLFKIYATFLQGKFWLLNSCSKPVKNIYFRMSYSLARGEVMMRPEDRFRLGEIEFRVCRFNSAKAKSLGTRSTMEDCSIMIHDLGVSNKLDVSLYAVFDGHRGTECARFLSERFPVLIRSKMTSTDNGQPIEIDQLDNIYLFMRGLLESVPFVLLSVANK